MKKIYTVLLSFTVILSFVSACKKLSQVPATSVTDATFWRSTNDLALACNALYPYLPGISSQVVDYYKIAPFQDEYGTDAYGTAANTVSDGTWLAPANSAEWTGLYTLVRIANNILQKSVTVIGDSATITKYLGEAKWFRAYAYFELVKRFGDVPLILQTLTTSDEELYSPRVPRESVLDTVYNDLDYAAAHCPVASSQAAAEYGRITRSAALALKSRIALFEGTWDKYHGGGDPTKHLQIAVTASNTIITEGKHNLFTYSANRDSSYYYLFQYASDGSLGYNNNKESILSKLYYGTTYTSYITQQNFAGVIGNRGFNATRSLMSQYLYKDGLPQGKSAYYKAHEDSSMTEFLNRDPRAGMTVFNKANKNNVYNVQIPYTLYIACKWYNKTDHQLDNGYGFNDFIVIRYAEVLLNYAEASYELTGAISDADLNKTINAIRNRASNNNTSRLAPLTNAFAAANGLDLLGEIRRERDVELALEGFHYWDLLRWKTAETEMPKALLGPKYFPNEMPNLATPNITADSIIIYEAATGRSFNPNRDYLWPIPTLQIALSKNTLTQNPGW
jgi:hypothetical protein